MDKRDELILQQTQLLRQLTEKNLQTLTDDLWGAPTSAPTAKTEKPDSTEEQKAETAPEAAQETAPAESIEALQEELESYIGLSTVKREVEDMIHLMTVWKLRREQGLPTADMSLHMVFTGNPGTGKTMIARLMARIYHALGILKTGQLVEVDRSGLVAGYVGQTAGKTAEVIQKALGGVLFIDEAYALSGKGENDYGQEAIETLLKAMEDHRDELVVIVAGYTDEMSGFIRSNPGLESRFNRYLYFPDYTPDEMVAIFRMRCDKNAYCLDDGAEEQLKAFLERESRDNDTFGNARGVRNLFERVLVAQANRLARSGESSREALMRLTAEDIAAASGETATAEETAHES